MFASGKAPFGGSDSLIKLSYAASASPASESGVSDSVNIHTVFLDPETKGTAGVRFAEDDSAEYCCTEQMMAESLCGEGVALGGFIIQANGTSHKPSVFTTTLTTSESAPVLGSGSTGVAVEGTQYVIVAACDKEGRDGAVLPDVSLAITVEFKNPYGYLPGQLYG